MSSRAAGYGVNGKESVAMNGNTVTRRRFLAGALAMPVLIPPGCITHQKGCVAPRRPVPSERVALGVIGYGTQGRYNTSNFMQDERVQVVAVCDCNRGSKLYGYNSGEAGGRDYGVQAVVDHLAKQTGKRDEGACRGFADFREMLEMEGLDAVLIATPDHWHATQAIAAMRRGKHVYCQKPLSLSVAEGRAICETARETGVTFQTGSQQRSDTYFKMAVEFVRNGRLGRIERVEIGLPKAWHKFYGRQGADASFEPSEVPDGLDYNLWLGTAPMRPYCSALQPLSWRSNYDFAGGVLTDWGAHHSDIVQWAFDEDLGGPVSIEKIRPVYLPPEKDIFNVAKGFSYDFVYANGARVTVSTDLEVGIRFYGEGGRRLFVTRGSIRTEPAALIREKIQPSEKHVYLSRSHERNFIDCIYSGEPTVAPAEVGHRSNTIGALAVIGLRTGYTTLKCDPRHERIIGNATADAMLTRAMRKWD